MNNNKFIFSILLFFTVVIAFYILNTAIPLFADDLPYSYFYPNHSYEDYAERFAIEITSVWDIFVSQWNHYFIWGGRCIVHFFVQLFCWSNHKDIYNVFATILFVIFLLSYVKLCFPKQKISKNLVTAVGCFGLLFYYLEEPNILYNGIAFGCNYLYSASVWTAFIYLLCHRRTNEKWRSMALYILAVLAGWSNESLSMPFCSATFVWALLNRKSLKKSELITLILCYVAAAVMILAPGNYARDSYPRSYWGMIQPGVENYWLLVLVAIWYLLYRKYPDTIKAFARHNLPLISGIFVAFLFLSYLGWCDGRPRYGFQLLVFILYARLLTALQWHRLIQGLKWIGVFLAVFGLPTIIYYQIPAGQEYRNLYAECEKESNDTVVFQFSGSPVPSPIRRFVCKHFYWTTYWDDKYTMRYKKPVYVTDAQLVNYKYPANDKLPGNNPFYKIDSYWITQEHLTDSITNIRVEQGDYQLWDLPTLLRRCYNIIKPIPATPMSFGLKTDSICIGKERYVYFLEQTDRTPRKLLSVDLIP